MQREPVTKRAVAFIDASNTRSAARRVFGEAFSNFNPVALAEEVCAAQGWTLAGVSYYLGVPDVRISEDGHYTWIKRCARWRKQGVHVFTRTLQHDDQGTMREKGIDLRLALDAVSQFRQGTFDVAVIFSQDQDFSELASELRAIAREQKRWIQIVSAFPAVLPPEGEAETTPARSGISGTIALPVLQDEFRKVLDTPENRKRVHTPLPAPEIFRGPAPGDTKTVSARPTVHAITEPVAVRSSRAPSNPLRFALTGAMLYLALAAATFGVLTWGGRAELTTREAALPALIDHAKQAALWPAYWFDREDLRNIKQQLTQIDTLVH